MNQTVVLIKNRSKGIYENSNIEKIHKFVCDIWYGYKNKFYTSQNPSWSTGAVRTMVYENVPDQHGIGHPPSRSYQIRLYMYYSDQWNYSVRYFTAMDVLRLVIRNRDTWSFFVSVLVRSMVPIRESLTRRSHKCDFDGNFTTCTHFWLAPIQRK